MLDVKKKLSSFIPSSARAQLQNVLTVEWDTHKTVLVQVPGAEPERGLDMEMGGMSRDTARDNYGRLDDDDEEAEALFDHSKFDESHARWKASKSSSSSSSRENTQPKSRAPAPPPIAPRPYDYAENPFDETSPSYQASFGQDYQQQRQYGQPGQDQSGQGKSWTTFGEGRVGQVKQSQGYGQGQGQGQGANPWGAGGQWSQASSPTSSRGTRESANYEAADPFR